MEGTPLCRAIQTLGLTRRSAQCHDAGAQVFTSQKVAMLFLRSPIIITILAPIALLAADEAKPKSSPAANRSENDQRSVYGELSKEKLKRQTDKLSDKRDALQEDIETFNQYVLRIETARRALAKVEPPNLEGEVKRVIDALVTLAAAPGNTSLFNQINTTGGAPITALIELDNRAAALVLDIVRPVIPGARAVTVGSRALNAAEEVADESASKFPEPRQKIFLAQFTPALLDYLNRLNSQPGVRRADVDKEIVAAQAEAKELTPKIKSFVEELRKKYAEILEAVDKAVQEARDSRSAELAAGDKQLSDMEKELNAREATVEKRQGTLTDNLLYTEGLMLLVIVIALICLRVYPQALAVTIVQEKTMGDLLGMGLLLITIIFLAAGEFVDKSALVTLLGTLAGYIFARRSPATPARDDSEMPSVLKAPQKLEQVPPIVPGQISLRCDPVAGASGYRWYTRSHRRTGRFTFRKKTSEPHVILEGFKHGESLDVAVSATNGREGKQSAPIQIDVK